MSTTPPAQLARLKVAFPVWTIQAVRAGQGRRLDRSAAGWSRPAPHLGAHPGRAGAGTTVQGATALTPEGTAARLAQCRRAAVISGGTSPRLAASSPLPYSGRMPRGALGGAQASPAASRSLRRSVTFPAASAV